jgi:6-pyruvoyl-tetrahydropterin synthase
MFLSDLTVVDHAYIDDRGNVVGGSFNPSFFVTGEIDPVEQVVVDFSAVKKQIKSIIDNKEFGFDHKLWFIVGYSAGTTSISGNTMEITTPTTRLVMPTNAVKIFAGREYSIHRIGVEMGRLVESMLRSMHPGAHITVECVNNVNCHVPTSVNATALFRYAHGLKESTSWGCKNIAHGHLSYIQLLPDSPQARSLANRIAADLDDTIFIYDANIVDGPADCITIEYTTERGYFRGEYKTDAYKLVVLPTETTVEHLVEYVAAIYGDEPTSVGVTMVLVSEGLSKGACITLSA